MTQHSSATACHVFDDPAERRPRSLFDWQPPAGVTVQQHERVDHREEATGREVYGQQFSARCACGRVSTRRQARADAIEELAGMHPAPTEGATT